MWKFYQPQPKRQIENLDRSFNNFNTVNQAININLEATPLIVCSSILRIGTFKQSLDDSSVSHPVIHMCV